MQNNLKTDHSTKSRNEEAREKTHDRKSAGSISDAAQDSVSLVAGLEKKTCCNGNTL